MPGERLRELRARHEAAAIARLTPDAYDYIAGGGGEEISVRDAADAWRRYRLCPRVLRDVSTIDTSTSVLGAALRAPVIAAPTAWHAIAHPDGEIATARGVTAAGSLMVVATRANMVLEDIAAELRGPCWFQVYVVRDRNITRELVLRAKAAGATALVLTGDTPFLSRRRHGASLPALTADQYLGNFKQHLAPGATIEHDTAQDPSITLDAIAWLIELAGLPVLVKGVLRADDATACLDAGAAGVIVSNHGGRQLDRVVSTAAALPGVVAATAGRGAVLVDGGIRSGIDLLVALALGAQAALVGRPITWALAADGAAGVSQLLDAMRDDLSEAMGLAGATAVGEIDSSLVTRSD